jgi:hypothetical protein
MKINNAVVEPVAIKWDNITLPLKEGTPISIGGNIANNGTAMGLVPVTVYNRPVASDRISILVSGDVDLAEVEKSFGSALEHSAKAAMSGIRFHKKDGTIDDSADNDTKYTLPTASPGTLGGIKIGTNLGISSGAAYVKNATKTATGAVRMAVNLPASTAADVAALKGDFNALLGLLKNAGIMEPDAQS